MSKDISTQYTKELNKKCGRNGYCQAHREKEKIISPSKYGMFIQSKKKETIKGVKKCCQIGKTLKKRNRESRACIS